MGVQLGFIGSSRPRGSAPAGVRAASHWARSGWSRRSCRQGASPVDHIRLNSGLRAPLGFRQAFRIYISNVIFRQVWQSLFVVDFSFGAFRAWPLPIIGVSAAPPRRAFSHRPRDRAPVCARLDWRPDAAGYRAACCAAHPTAGKPWGDVWVKRWSGWPQAMPPSGGSAGCLNRRQTPW